MKKISIISALSHNYVIGNKGDLPWHIPEDFKLFVQITKGKPVIMGRKTWESLPKKPLPGRTNIVISRKQESGFKEALVGKSIEEAIDIATKEHPEVEEVMILGGSSIYKEALDKNLVTTMYLSHVKGEFQGDTFFPEFDKNNFRIEEEKEYEDFIFRRYEKK